jgi:hypothetical protein
VSLDIGKREAALAFSNDLQAACVGITGIPKGERWASLSL